MGRAIHAHVEVFNEETGRWFEMAGLPEWDRYHRVFDIIAGANGREDEYPPIMPPRGIPLDMSEEVAKAYNDDWWQYNPHHVGHLTVREMLAYDWLQHGHMTEWFHADYLPRLERLGPPDKVRLIFWFDN